MSLDDYKDNNLTLFDMYRRCLFSNGYTDKPLHLYKGDYRVNRFNSVSLLYHTTYTNTYMKSLFYISDKQCHGMNYIATRDNITSSMSYYKFKYYYYENEEYEYDNEDDDTLIMMRKLDRLERRNRMNNTYKHNTPLRNTDNIKYKSPMEVMRSVYGFNNWLTPFNKYIHNYQYNKNNLDNISTFDEYEQDISDLSDYEDNTQLSKAKYQYSKNNNKGVTKMNVKKKEQLKKLGKRAANTVMWSAPVRNLKYTATNAITNYAVDYVTQRFVKVELFKFSEEGYDKFLKILKKYDKNYERHTTTVSNNVNKTIMCEVDFVIKIGGAVVRLMTGRHITKSLNDYEIINNSSSYSYGDSTVKMMFVGKIKDINKIIDKFKSFETSSQIGSYVVSANKKDEDGSESDPRIMYSPLNRRSIDSVFLNDDTKDRILKHINRFFDNSVIYKNRNLNFKTGILLYGEPGTGKSSLANAIASHFNMDLIIINMTEFQYININMVTKAINSDNKPYVVLLEDIDCVIGDRNSDDDSQTKKNVNKLLQFLDSASSPSNVIFIATTNHIEKLDEAIKRDGRFDIKVQITDFVRPTAEAMCRSFELKPAIIKEILDDNMVNGKINPAKLQNLILKNLDYKVEVKEDETN